MAPLVPSGQISDTLGPAKLRKDGGRLGLLSALSIVYALCSSSRSWTSC